MLQCKEMLMFLPLSVAHQIKPNIHLKDCFITVLWMVLADTGGHPLNIGSLLLIFDFVDCVEQPADPGGSVFLLEIYDFENED